MGTAFAIPCKVRSSSGFHDHFLSLATASASVRFSFAGHRILTMPVLPVGVFAGFLDARLPLAIYAGPSLRRSVAADPGGVFLFSPSSTLHK